MASNSIVPAKQRRHLVVGALLVLAAGLFAAAAVAARDDTGSSRSSASQLERVLPAPKSGTLAASAFSTVRPREQMPIPVRILIPAIGANAPIIPLCLNRDRTIQVLKTGSTQRN